MLLLFVHLVHVWIPDLSIDCFKNICLVISLDYGLNEVILPFSSENLFFYQYYDFIGCVMQMGEAGSTL